VRFQLRKCCPFVKGWKVAAAGGATKASVVKFDNYL